MTTHKPVDHEREENVMGNRSYDEIEETKDDVSTPARAKEMRDSEISAKHMSPQDLVHRLQHDNVVVVLRRHWIGQLPLIALTFFLILLAITIAIQLADPFALVALSSMPLVSFAALLHKFFNRKYIINADTLTIVAGIVSLKVTRVSIPIARFKAVEVTRSLMQRILGVGNVQVSTVLYDQPEVAVVGVRNPHFYDAVLRIMNDKLAPEQPAS